MISKMSVVSDNSFIVATQTNTSIQTQGRPGNSPSQQIVSPCWTANECLFRCPKCGGQYRSTTITTHSPCFVPPKPPSPPRPVSADIQVLNPEPATAQVAPSTGATRRTPKKSSSPSLATLATSSLAPIPKKGRTEGICGFIDLKRTKVLHGVTKCTKTVPPKSLIQHDSASTACYVLKPFVKPLIASGYANVIIKDVEIKVYMLGDAPTNLVTDLVSIYLVQDRAEVHIHALVLDHISKPPRLCEHSVRKLKSLQRLYSPFGVARQNSNLEWATPSRCNDYNPKDYRIVLLIGQPICWELLLDAPKKIPSTHMYHILTPFGVIMSGTLVTFCSCPTETSSFVTKIEALSHSLDQLFRAESLCHDDDLTMTSDELQAFRYITANTHYLPDKKYFVTRLLWKPLADGSPGPPKLNSTYAIAIKRFFTMEKQLRSRPQLYTDLVISSVQEHIDSGAYQLIDPKEAEWYKDPRNKDTYCLAFRLVFREGHPSTPCRACFDGSQKIPGMQVSLNDLLHAGASNLHSMYRLQLRWRSGKYCFVTDVSRMFLSVRIAKEDWKYQVFPWRRPNSDEPIRLYFGTRVIFGMKSSPYSASYALNSLAQMKRDDPKSSHEVKQAAHLILTSIYMDDLLGYCDTIQEGQALIRGIETILKDGSFTAAKYSASDPKLLQQLPKAKLAKQGVSEKGEPVIYGENEIFENPAGFRNLGQLYTCDQGRDEFVFGGFTPLMEEMLNLDKWTKRTLASCLARASFDLVGLRAGVSLKLRIFMRSVMQSDHEAQRPVNKSTWDRELDKEIADQFKVYLKQLPELDKVSLPRYLNFKATDLELHGFSDASNNGQAACIYLRTKDPNSKDGYKVDFVIGKAKVRPLNAVTTIPREELEAARLLARLFQTVLDAHDLSLAKCFCWTDSSCVYFWLKQPLGVLTPFCSNRIKAIKDLGLNQWSYVASSHNAADQPAKSMMPRELIDEMKPIYKTGPLWLRKDKSQWPEFKLNSSVKKENTFLDGIRRSTVIQTFRARAVRNPDILKNPNPIEVSTFVPYHKVTCRLFTSTNSHTKIVMRVATFICFFYYLKHKLDLKKKKSTTCVHTHHVPKHPYIPNIASQLYRARLCIFSYVQQQHYLDEIYALSQGGPIEQTSNLLQHCPFLDTVDHVQVLRSDTRLGNAERISVWKKYPILLPSFSSKDKDSPVRALAMHLHVTMHHNTAASLERTVRNGGIHIVKPGEYAKNIIKQCVTCDRRNSRTTFSPLMGMLPADRCDPDKYHVFQSLALDHFGPLSVRSSIYANSDVATRGGAQSTTKKCYALILTCQSSRFTNVVLSPGLSLHDFLTAFQSHCGQYGFPTVVHSDNYASYRGADRIFGEMLQNNEHELAEFALKHNFRWNFALANFPSSHGNIEAMVKILKRLCAQHMDPQQPLTFAALQSELHLACLMANLRPLGASVGADECIQPITPFMLAMGYQPDMVMLSNLDRYVLPNLQEQWRMRVKNQKSFIVAFKSAYLQLLAKRQKWQQKEPCKVKVGAVCLLDNSELMVKRQLWPLVKVIELKMSKDRVCRKALVRFADGNYDHTKSKKSKGIVRHAPTEKVVSIHQLRVLESFPSKDEILQVKTHRTCLCVQQHWTHETESLDSTNHVNLATMLSRIIWAAEPTC